MYCDRYLKDSITMSPRDKSVCVVGVVKLQLDRVDGGGNPTAHGEARRWTCTLFDLLMRATLL